MLAGSSLKAGGARAVQVEAGAMALDLSDTLIIRISATTLLIDTEAARWGKVRGGQRTAVATRYRASLLGVDGGALERLEARVMAPCFVPLLGLDRYMT